MSERNHHRIPRRELLKAGGTLATAYAATTAVGSLPATAAKPATTVETENLGPGLLAFTTFGATSDGERLFLGSRNISPGVVATYDLTTKQVTHNAELSTSGAVGRGFLQGMTVLDGYVYTTASQGNANFWRYDPASTEVTPLRQLPHRVPRDLATSPDGKIYAVGLDPNNVYEYDPSTDELTDLGTPNQPATQLRSVSATETTVFVGLTGRPQAHLVAIDRATGEMTTITPPEIARDSRTVYWQEISGRRLVVATDSTNRTTGHLAVINLDDYDDYEIISPVVASHYGPIEIVDDTVYFLVNDGWLRSYHVPSGEVTDLACPLPSNAGQTLTHIDGELVGVAFTAAWSYSLSSGDVQLQGLVDVGAQGAPQQAQAIAASDREVYVSGTGIIGARDLETGELSSLVGVPGEAKDMTFVGRHRSGELWLAQYGAVSRLWRYEPQEDELPALVVPEFHEFSNRPRDVAYDEHNDLVLALIAGARPVLVVYDPGTGDLRNYPAPGEGGDFGSWSLTCLRGIAYIGSSGGTVTAWDPIAGEELWRTSSPTGGTVMGLAARGLRLYGVTRTDALFVVHLARRQVIHTQQSIGIGAGGRSRLAAGHRAVYGANPSKVFRIDPSTFVVETLVDDLQGDWFARGYIAVVGHDIYTLAGRDVIRVREIPIT